jgi:hypothetical protein
MSLVSPVSPVSPVTQASCLRVPQASRLSRLLPGQDGRGTRRQDACVTHDACVTNDSPIGLPLRRYRPPVPAEVRLERGEPVELNSEIVRGKIAGHLGPYRLSGHWWDDRWACEQWDIETEAGHGLYRLSRRKDGWFLEGLYDGEVC